MRPTRQIEFRPRASLDLEGIVVHISVELKSPQAAQSTAEAIFNTIDKLAEFPEIGRPFYDDDLKLDYRRMLVKRYWIYYTFTDEKLTLWRIFHATQDHDNYGFVDLWD